MLWPVTIQRALVPDEEVLFRLQELNGQYFELECQPFSPRGLFDAFRFNISIVDSLGVAFAGTLTDTQICFRSLLSNFVPAAPLRRRPEVGKFGKRAADASSAGISSSAIAVTESPCDRP